MTDVNLDHIVDVACGNLELLIEDNNGVIIREALPVITYNETQLLQLMQNLIANALRYRGTEPPRIAMQAERQAAGWKISVRDNGVGFDMSRADEIFKPFNRLQLKEMAVPELDWPSARKSRRAAAAGFGPSQRQGLGLSSTSPFPMPCR